MKIAVAGYYGHENLGDELNLLEMLKLLQRQFDNPEITVFSGGLGGLWNRVSYNIVLSDMYSIDEYADILNTFDIVIVGGGGLINLGANYFLCLTDKIKVPYFFSRVGIDDRMVNPKVCSQLSKILKNSAGFTVRTQYDKLLARKYLDIDCDVVYEAIWNYRVNPCKIANTSLIMNITPYTSLSARESIRDSLCKIDPSVSIFAVSMQSISLDQYTTLSTYNSQIIPDTIGLERKAECLAGADLVISSRLHALLVSINHNVPVLALSGVPKVDFLMRDIGLQDLLVTDDTLLTSDILMDLINSKDVYKDSLQVIEYIRESAKNNIIT